ncbi:MAG: type IV secretion system DNA-binding domain-containing protein [Acidiferrobacter thiooxydans]
MSGLNDPNSHNGRTEVSFFVAALAALAGWVAGVQGVLFFYDDRTAPLYGIWQLITTWGPLLHPWGWKGYIPSVTAAMAALGVGAGAWTFLTVAPERHIRGYRLYRDPKAIASALRPGKEVPGVHVHPQITISQRMECDHFMVVGGTGAGKTTVIWPWIQEAVARKDLVLIFDSKGDFTQKTPEPFTLLSPTDARSARWILGRDIRTPLEAQDLAVTLIQEPPGGSKSDPMWIQGSRAILAGLITDLQTRYGEDWGLDHLAYECAAALSDFDRLKTVILREAPICIILLGGEEAEGPNRTTMGFLTQIVASFTNVIHLGVAANDLKVNPGWSVRQWLAGKTPPTVVIGFRGEQSELMSQSFAASIIERVVKQVGGFRDAAPDQRRIWLCIDETPVAGHLPSITTSLTTLRSKGVRTVLGFQTLASVREKYSKDVATIWQGQCGIKIVSALGATEDQEWASRLLGDREVERYTHQLSQQSHSDAGGQHSQSWQRVREPILMPATFGQELGMQTDSQGRLLGPRALLIGGNQAAILDWPLTPRTSLREPVVDARWIQPGYKPPAWGKTPPVVAVPLLPKSGEIADPEKPKKEKETIVTVTPSVSAPDPDLLSVPLVVPESV